MAGRGCRLDHGKLPKDTGENLFGASALRGGGPDDAIMAIAPTEVVDAWASEVRDYNHSKNKCASGKHCGHYTQIVWRDTTAAGCAPIFSRSGTRSLMAEIFFSLMRMRGASSSQDIVSTLLTKCGET